MRNRPHNHAILVQVVNSGVKERGKGKGRQTPDDLDAVVGDVLLLFRVIVKVLQLALFSKIMNTPAALANGWKDAQIFDRLLCRCIEGANEHGDDEGDGKRRGRKLIANGHTTGPSRRRLRLRSL